MKTYKSYLRLAKRITLIPGVVVLIAGLAQVRASADSGIYLGTDVGLNVPNNLNTSQGSISLDTGVRADASIGYAFGLPAHLTLAPEIQAGVMYDATAKASSQGQTASVSGSYTQVPIMVNAVLKWRFHGGWDVFGGLGLGGDYSSLSIGSANGIAINSSASEFDFAWQGKVGIGYQFGPSEIGLGYNYLAVKPSGLQTVGNSTIFASFTFTF